MSLKDNIHALFAPKTVAVIGASAAPGKVGHTVVANMLEAGYKGTLIPVNPKADEILGLPVTKKIEDLPEGLDMAVIVVPVAAVVPSMEALAKRKVRSAVIITAGFKEVGKEGYALEQRLIELCTEHEIAMVGPNCLGLISTHDNNNASFAAGYPEKGSIAFFSQSGALCTAILDWALGENVGFSKFVSLGNKAVINEGNMLEYLRTDPNTSVILGYIENVEHGADFIEQAAKVTQEKPVIMIKSGTTTAGAKAASSHTGAIAGSDQAYTAAFRKTGVIRANDMATLFDLAQAFSTQPLPEGPGLCIVTNSGGPGILAADATEKSSLNMARLSNSTIERMKEFLPPYASLYNPVDLIGDAPAERYRKTLEVVIDDPQVHSILVLLTPTASAEIIETAEAIIEVSKKTKKPIFVNYMGGQRTRPGQKMLTDAGIPCSIYPEPLIKSIETMYNYYLWRQTPAQEYPEVRRNRQKARLVINEARSKGATEVVEFQAQEVLRAYNLPTPNTGLARSSDEAVAAADKIGYPVVLKIASPQISHKSDVGGVKVNLADAEAVRNAFFDITARAQRMRPEAYIAGCLVQEMAPKGCKEIIIGFKRDDQFGPLLMFGLGGIYVEILKDIAFRLAPLGRDDAKGIIREIKSYMLLKGVRGEQPVNFQAIEDILITMSELALDFPEIVEAEFNPVLVNAEKAVVADVRITLSA
ncbi:MULTISPECIES: acetate--CoA ligase alpha subunit [Solidesulfovibrio]|uniref:CoA-binding domain protein n=2 Tax=Solidesulfovibrio TaxID=2910984 RepID=C4XRF0_SOLM1|nr:MULTISPECIES: acetate--CoA ligase [Solidesulfovibrio]QAZ67444.1 acyl-CoA synthetase [Solidesulfovibrio carbinolicus]BAH75495.1 CoA-binding domain protein [Solidesulfovibrio magneticus RS-1]